MKSISRLRYLPNWAFLRLPLANAQEGCRDVAGIPNRDDANSVRKHRRGFRVELHEVRILQHEAGCAVEPCGDIGDMAFGAILKEGKKVRVGRVKERVFFWESLARLYEAIRSQRIWASGKYRGIKSIGKQRLQAASCRNAVRHR